MRSRFFCAIVIILSSLMLFSFSSNLTCQVVAKNKISPMEIKLKGGKEADYFYSLLDFGGNSPLVIMRGKTKSGKNAIICMVLNKKGIAKKYNVLFSTKGTIQNVDAVVVDDHALLFFVYREPTTSPLPAGNPDWTTYFAVQNVSSSGSGGAVTVTYSNQDGTESTHSEVKAAAYGGIVGSYYSHNVYGQSGWLPSLYFQTYNSDGVSTSDPLQMPLPDSATGSCAFPVGTVGLPGDGGFVGAAVVEGSGQQQLVAIAAQQPAPGQAYQGYYNTFATVQCPKTFNYYTSFAVQNVGGQAANVCHVFYGTEQYGSGTGKPEYTQPTYYTQQIGTQATLVGNPVQVTGIREFTDRKAGKYLYDHYLYSQNWSGATVVSGGGPVVAISNVQNFYGVYNVQGPQPSASKEVFEQHFAIYKLNVTTRKAKKLTEVVKYYKYSNFRDPVLKNVGKRLWMVSTGYDYGPYVSNMYLSVY